MKRWLRSRRQIIATNNELADFDANSGFLEFSIEVGLHCTLVNLMMRSSSTVFFIDMEWILRSLQSFLWISNVMELGWGWVMRLRFWCVKKARGWFQFEGRGGGGKSRDLGSHFTLPPKSIVFDRYCTPLAYDGRLTVSETVNLLLLFNGLLLCLFTVSYFIGDCRPWSSSLKNCPNI